MFTGCLPSAQKGDPVKFNFLASQLAPVKPSNERQVFGTQPGVKWSETSTGNSFTADLNDSISITGVGGTTSVIKGKEGGQQVTTIYPNNLVADVKAAGAVSVNDFRTAVTLQHMLELDARGGTRYVEYLSSHFGVFDRESSFNRSEYLGGIRQPVGIQTVPQTSATDPNSTPQANLSAYSVTAIEDPTVKTRTFTQHGFLIGLATIRYHHTYQQNLRYFWSWTDQFSLYDPNFANISEQPIYQKEIYFTGKKQTDDSVFGFNEAYVQLRYTPNYVTGKFRSTVKDTLDI